MNFFDKIGEEIVNTIDIIVEKNRQFAQLNRLAAIIKNEKAVLEHAYATLGKQYYRTLENNEESVDAKQICEVIKFTEARLKKAQARYDYIRVFGMPVNSVDDVEVAHPVDDVSGDCETEDEPKEEEEAEDITIAVADETGKQEAKEETEPKTEKETAQKKEKSGKSVIDSVDAEAADDE